MAWKDVISLLVPGTGIYPALSRREDLSLVEKLAILKDCFLLIAIGFLTYR